MLRYFFQNCYPSNQLMESGAGAPRSCGSESMGGREGGSLLALSFTPLWSPPSVVRSASGLQL